MSPERPYNCTRPGNLFVGREALREKVLRGFDSGDSYAIVGGRRSGKTSLLLKLKADMLKRNKRSSDVGERCLIPVYLDIQSLSIINTEVLFERMYSLLGEHISLPIWREADTINSYEHSLQLYLQHLGNLEQSLEQKFGGGWVVVYLIDELDITAEHLTNDQFFHNLRNLLMVSDLHNHVRVIASGVTGMQKLIATGSPLNNLRKIPLSVLTKFESYQLVNAGFSTDPIKQDVMESLLEVSGRHPWIMQAILERFWDYHKLSQDELSVISVEKASQEFLKEHSTFDTWFDAFGDDEHAVYTTLLNSPNNTLHLKELNKRMFCDDALDVLSYHGVVDDQDPDQPRVSSILFRDWYMRRTSKIRLSSFGTKKAPVTKASGDGKMEIRIFLASSSEMEKHRDQLELFLLRKNNDQMNGFSMNVIRWENFLDAIAEDGLQNEYNKEIETCQIFISLFRTKTGRYTEEEFDVAHQHFLEVGFPKIYTFFEKADVPNDIANRDALNSLWSFQDKLKKLGHYYTDYNNIEDLQLRVDDQIKRLIGSNVFNTKNKNRSTMVD